MRNRTKVIFIFMLIMLSHVISAYAERDGFLVKFNEGYIPDIYEYNLKEVNDDRGIYSTNNLEDLKAIEEYIEYTAQNSVVTLIEEETVSPFSLPEDEFYPEQWQLQLINADARWKL